MINRLCLWISPCMYGNGGFPDPDVFLRVGECPGGQRGREGSAETGDVMDSRKGLVLGRSGSVCR